MSEKLIEKWLPLMKASFGSIPAVPKEDYEECANALEYAETQCKKSNGKLDPKYIVPLIRKEYKDIGGLQICYDGSEAESNLIKDLFKNGSLTKEEAFERLL